MYFSLITPAEGRERDAARQWATANAYGDHQWMWRFFAAAAGAPRDFLFRRSEVDGLPRFYAVSHRAPRSPADAWQVQSRPYEPQLQTGQRLQFELRANPTVRHGRDGKSKRHDVVMDAKKRFLSDKGLTRWSDLPAGDVPATQMVVHEACTHWLQRQGERHGFMPDAERLSVDAYQQHTDARDRRLSFSSVDFRGELVVTDAAACLHALYRGLGHAKAFGCGLLLVNPAA